MRFTALLTAVWVVLFNAISNAQVLEPVFILHDNPITHNMSITSDGTYFYTINGGIKENGRIAKYDTSGRLISTYKMPLDMRSILYDKNDSTFYICTYGADIYKVTNLETGSYELWKDNLYPNEQASPALSPDGKKLYYFDNGVLTIYSFPNGEIIKTYVNIKSGSEAQNGSTSVAVDKKYIYTYDGETNTVYVYSKKGKLNKKIKISKGNYGFSLSCAMNFVFIAEDGNFTKKGTWYGYKIE